MNPTTTEARRRLAGLERRLKEIQDEVARLEGERVTTRTHLEALRRELTHCPKCGREEDFLTDGGGYLAHVLEEPDDTDLLTPGKPLFCPACGEVFLYAAPPAVILTAIARRR